MTARVAVLQRIRDAGVIPVVRAASAGEALQAVDAIRAGGLPVVEITLTVPDAVALIARLAATYPDLLVGAGTVPDAEAARACIDAGARFVVSPALDAGTVALCRQRDVAVLPGALTPTEIVQAHRLGADLVKVFPAGALGGPAYIRSLQAALPHIGLVPTGGVTLANAAGFIEAGAAAIGVGAELVNLAALRAGRAQAVTDMARAYVDAVREARRRCGSR